MDKMAGLPRLIVAGCGGVDKSSGLSFWMAPREAYKTVVTATGQRHQ
jgi:hypothetical protein